ncbi:hypothetical protein CYLTODRAFT_421089 [Cylindrobasidium torrendii FP15055 ss-10]|uniref:Uncharacterized protein n=1 Tax=Cylindrobasidium torrendii FP15055 ss-10 TaxID=1314674 RepID=A0A0D7BEX3_9AGAR|nr:hypothetical protein CYLTODRAFT_421089 [Cylindrobasidium torrendii FP15055 ss-10]
MSCFANYSGSWSPLTTLFDVAKVVCPELFYDLRASTRGPSNSPLPRLQHSQHQDPSHYIEGRPGFDELPHDASWDEDAARLRRESALRERGLLPRNDQAPTRSTSSTAAAHPTPTPCAPSANRTYTPASDRPEAFRQADLPSCQTQQPRAFRLTMPDVRARRQQARCNARPELNHSSCHRPAAPMNATDGPRTAVNTIVDQADMSCKERIKVYNCVEIRDEVERVHDVETRRLTGIAYA